MPIKEQLHYPLSTSTSALKLLKDDARLCDLVIKYKSDGLEVERQFNKTVLIMQSQYFFSALFNSKIKPSGQLWFQGAS